MTPEAEIEAASSSAVLLPAAAGPHRRAFLRITGADATRWLNGMATNSIRSLAPGEGNYNFFLNAQGRIQGDGYVFREPDAADAPAGFLLATTAGQVEGLRAMLDHYIIMDDVTLEPAFTEFDSFVLAGPKAAEAVAAFGLVAPAAPGMRHGATPEGDVLLFALPFGSLPLLEFTAPEPVLLALRTALLASGIEEAGPMTLEHLRLLEGVPRFGDDIRDRDLPQETNQTQALHFNKGCYLGQEIVERIRSRGQVHRALTGFELTGELPTALPAPLEAGGKPAGELTSAAVVPTGGGHRLLALGYARRELLETHQTLTYAGGTAVPRRTPARLPSPSA